MRSNDSFADKISWLGEQAQTQFLDLNLESHEVRSPGGSPFPSTQRLSSYNSLDFDQKHTIRHQVIVWSVGIPDVKSHTVSIMFRVTLFWNDPPKPKPIPVQFPVLPPLNHSNGGNINTNMNVNANMTGNMTTNIATLIRQRSNSNASSSSNLRHSISSGAINIDGPPVTNTAGANGASSNNSHASSNSNSNFDSNNKNHHHDNSSSSNDKEDESFWVMDGRRKAVRRMRSFNGTAAAAAAAGSQPPNNNNIDEQDTVDVPPISIINAETFETVGQADVTLLRKKSRLMRFSCMYRAKLMQESMNVAQFPHDSHDLVLKLGILSQRQPEGRWDRRKWKLGLANESDTQGSVRVPFGVLVDHVAVPGFRISDRGLEFELAPIEFGHSAASNPGMAALNYNSNGINSNSYSNKNNNNRNNYNNRNLNSRHDQEFCVKTKIRVKRNSAYYDRNIMPLLDILNLVSISILVSLDATNFFQRGLLCLNIAFVEVGLRTSLDARLPTVGYEIKMQKLLNSFFFSILYIVLESAAMKVLIENHHWPVQRTRFIDRVVASLLLVNQLYLRMVIYKDFSSEEEFSDWR